MSTPSSTKKKNHWRRQKICKHWMKLWGFHPLQPNLNTIYGQSTISRIIFRRTTLLWKSHARLKRQDAAKLYKLTVKERKRKDWFTGQLFNLIWNYGAELWGSNQVIQTSRSKNPPPNYRRFIYASNCTTSIFLFLSDLIPLPPTRLGQSSSILFII